jgi:hypothetical protein
MRLISLLTAAVLILVGCEGADTTMAPDDVVARAAYSPGGQPTITLYTMVSNDTGAGGHTAVMINGSQRVLYDPAGSWRHPLVPEQGDVHFGFTEFMRSFYIDFHARTTYHVVVQELPVSLAQANAAIAAVRAQGAAPPAYCARYTSTALNRVPGLEGLGTTWYPVSLMERFAEVPGVRTEKIFDDDPDYNRTMLEAGIVPIPRDQFTAAN